MLQSVNLRDYMLHNPVKVRATDNVFDAMQVIINNKISGVCVVDDDSKRHGENDRIAYVDTPVENPPKAERHEGGGKVWDDADRPELNASECDRQNDGDEAECDERSEN